MGDWKYYTAGIGHVGSYQAAGAPWLSSSFIEKGQNAFFLFPMLPNPSLSLTLEASVKLV